MQGGDEFLSAFRADGTALAPLTPDGLLAHPLVRYVNAVKHRNPITRSDFSFSLESLEANAPIGLMAVAAARPSARPVNWRTIALLLEVEKWTVRGARVLPLFRAMHELGRGDPRAVNLYRQMACSYPSKMPWIKEAWKRFVKTRVSWLTRLKLELV